MIHYLTVVFNNYELLDIQSFNFLKRFPKKDYKFTVIDNSLNSHKKNYEFDRRVIDRVISIDSNPDFDGVSHGRALDYGVSLIDDDIIAIIDSDFFILNNGIHEYVNNKFTEGYKAVGTEYNDGDATKAIVASHPKDFENIPCCFGSYYAREVASSASWQINSTEVSQNRSSGFVEVGWRIRKHILTNNIKTHNWKTDAVGYGNCYFKNEIGDTMGVHYVAGSHRRWNAASRQELNQIIERF